MRFPRQIWIRQGWHLCVQDHDRCGVWSNAVGGYTDHRYTRLPAGRVQGVTKETRPEEWQYTYCKAMGPGDRLELVEATEISPARF